MAAEIKTDFALNSELIAGDKGIFDLIIDGEVCYSKFQTGRFPIADEIKRLIETKSALINKL
ncbi:MAG: Rdx family protein [Pseudomonadales bacterium]|nr:Rdx family protein [Pseudomonadales bacterium]